MVQSEVIKKICPKCHRWIFFWVINCSAIIMYMILIFAIKFNTGIPYASPPVGKLRFMPPVTPIPWNGILNATKVGPVCPQKLPNISDKNKALTQMTKERYEMLLKMFLSLQNQSENCLYLNIYAPKLSKFEQVFAILIFLFKLRQLKGKSENILIFFFFANSILLLLIR